MTRVPLLLLALGLVTGLMACQDGGVVAPDDLQPQFAKPDVDCTLPNPHPSCKPGDPGGDPSPTAYVTWETGMVGGPTEVEVQEDTENWLTVVAPNPGRVNLTVTQGLFPMDGGEFTGALPPTGECKVNFSEEDTGMVIELVEMLVDDESSPITPYRGSRAAADLSKDYSRKNLVTFNHYVPNESWSWVRRIHRNKLAPEFGSPKVVAETLGHTTTLTFSEGAVMVYRKSQSPTVSSYALVCENQDVVRVIVERIPPTSQ